MNYFIEIEGEKSRLAGINSKGEFVFESNDSHLLFWTLPLGELFEALVEDDTAKMLYHETVLSYDEVIALRQNLRKSLHYKH
jgi:hypothetical protein